MLLSFVCVTSLGCADDVTEKTHQMLVELHSLKILCPHTPDGVTKKFTGSMSTIRIWCDNFNINVNSPNNQNHLQDVGWAKKERSDSSIVYCFKNTGIEMVTTFKKIQNTNGIILQYPSASCRVAKEARDNGTAIAWNREGELKSLRLPTPYSFSTLQHAIRTNQISNTRAEILVP